MIARASDPADAPPAADDFDAKRRDFLGASEVPAIVGLDPFKTALDVWARKVGLAVRSPQSPQAANGNRYERVILDEYAEIRRAALSFPGTLRLPGAEWIAATPDAIADAVRNVQVKGVGRRMARRWEDGPPDYVLVQVQWEMLVARLDVTDVVAKFGVTDPPEIFAVERDEGVIADLVDVCEAWWERHVARGEMPEIVEGDEALGVLRARFPKATAGLLPMPGDVEALARAYDAARSLEDAAKREKERIAAEICARIGEAEGFDSEAARVTWKERAAHMRPAVRIEAGRVLRVTLKGE